MTDRWLFDRALDRVRVIDSIVAEYATSVCGRPARRRDHPPGRADEGGIDTDDARVAWSIDGDVLVEFRPSPRGRGVVSIHEIGLLEPLRKQLRSRHLVVEYRTR